MIKVCCNILAIVFDIVAASVNTDLRINMTLNLGKVCAGKEVENTRMFLQHFCRATKIYVDILGVEKVKLESAQTKFAMGMSGVDTGGSFTESKITDGEQVPSETSISTIAEARAIAEAEAELSAEAEAKVKAEADAKAKAEADAKAKADAEAKAKADAEAKARADAEAEAKAKADAEAKANAAAAEAEANAKAAAEAEASAKADAEAKARAEAEAAAAKAKAAADARAKAEAEAKLKAEKAAQQAKEAAAAAEKSNESPEPTASEGESKSPSSSRSRRRRKSSSETKVDSELSRTPTQQLSSLLASHSPAKAGSLDLSVELAKSRAAITAIISKPELTDKLMGRPPFTFLHAIIRGILAATGYNPTLFSADELNPKTITSKVAKMAFLEKIALVVSKDVGKPVPVRYGKICAGKEVANTHVFLQHICEAATTFKGSAPGNSEPEEKGSSLRRKKSMRRRNSLKGMESKTSRHSGSSKHRKAATSLQSIVRRFLARKNFKQLIENIFLTKLEVQEAMDMARVTKSTKDLKDVVRASRSTLPPGHKLSIEAHALIKELEVVERILRTLRRRMAEVEKDNAQMSDLMDAVRDAERVVDHNHDLLVQARVLQAAGLAQECESRLRDTINAFRNGGASTSDLKELISSAQTHLEPHNATLIEARKLASSKSQDALDRHFDELIQSVERHYKVGSEQNMFDAIDDATTFAYENLTADSPGVARMNNRFREILGELATKQKNPRKYGAFLPDRQYTMIQVREGSIGAGFGFKAEAWACVVVRLNSGKDGGMGQIERSGQVQIGDWLVRVADHDVRGQSWNYVKQVIKNSVRPVVMTFCKPFDWMSARLIELPHDFVSDDELNAAQKALDLGDMGRTMGKYQPPGDWDEKLNVPKVHKWLKGALRLSQTDQRCRKICKCILGSDGLFQTATWHNPNDTLFCKLQEQAAKTLSESAHTVDQALFQKQHLVDVLGLHPENDRAFEIVINKKGLPTRKYAALPRQDDEGLLPQLLWTDAEDDYTYMCCVLLAMVALNRGFQNVLRKKIQEFDGNHRAAPIKSPMKIWKTLSSNSDGSIESPVAANELDLMRCCGSFSDPQDLLACYESIVADMGDAVNVENQFGQGFDAVKKSGGFRSVVVNCVYSPPGLTWGQVFRSKQTQEIWEIWARSMEAQLGSDMWDLLGEFVEHAKSVLVDCVGLASRPVRVIAEIKLTLKGYVEHLKKSTLVS